MNDAQPDIRTYPSARQNAKKSALSAVTRGKTVSMKRRTERSGNILGRSFWAWAVTPALLCIGALWWNFGFTLGGMIEEWDFIWMMNHHPGFWNSFAGNPMSDQFVARPLQITPFAVAYAFDHYSFLGFHIVLMLACVLRIISGASIGYFAFRSRRYALTLGLLFFLFPADTQQMSFRTLSISVALALMTLGSACSLRALVGRTANVRAAHLIAASILSCVAVLIYEPVVTLYALTPLTLFARYGWPKLRLVMRRRRLTALLWFAAPIISTAYLVYSIVILKSGYQAGFSHAGIGKTILGNMRFLWQSWTYRVFWDAWVSTIEILATRSAHYVFLCTIAVAIVAILTFADSPTGRPIALARTARYVFMGLIAGIAGYLPFMVDVSHLVSTQRTFMAVAPGISILLVAVIAFLFRYARMVGIAVASIFVFLGFVAQLYQFDVYNRYYVNVIRPYMSMMADMTDLSKKVHLVEDTSGVGGYLNGMYISKIRAGAADRLHDTTDVYALCQNRPRSPLVLRSECRLEGGAWVVDDFDRTARYPEQSVQIMKIGKNFDPAYRSTRGGWNDRASFTVEKSIFKSDTMDTTSFSCTADSDWGYAGFCRGEGWTNGMFRISDHVNYFLATSPNPTFLFYLNPAAQPYKLSIETLGIDPKLSSQMSLSMNRKHLAMKITGTRIEADVPRALIIDGLNEIELSNMRRPDQPAGVAVHRFAIVPARP